MSDTVMRDRFNYALSGLLQETFEQVLGIYLDRGTSLFETLDTISAEEASIPVGGRCATLAAQVAHVNFYLNVMSDYIQGKQSDKIDWQEIWRTVSAVTPEEWEASKAALRETYQRVRAQIHAIESWEGENEINGALGVIVHTAYHLGEIRQALCTIQQR
ncbi:MAG: DinB family protein [Chloroflexota bacterium]|nr:MAG: DinB family protein [Chloroflexota bacterium]